MGPVMALCLAVELLWVAGTAAAEAGEAYELVVAPVGPQNPRNSEAAIIQLKNGSLLLAWTEFYAGSGADHGPRGLWAGSRPTTAVPGATSTRWSRTTAAAT